MAIFKIIIIILSIFPEESFQTDAVTVAQVTQSVADSFKVTCIVFFTPGGETSIHETFQEIKIMSRAMKIVATRNFQPGVTAYRYNSQRCPQMLYVLDGEHDNVRTVLEKISHSVNLGGPIWLIFLPESDTAEEYLRNVYVPFDSNFIAVETRDTLFLRHVYRVTMKHDIRTTPFGNWTADEGFTLIGDYSPYWHRSNLEGKSFRVSAIESWPLATVTPDNTVGGYFGTVWKELQERLNFSTVYIKPKEHATGVYTDGRWTGLIGMISRGEIDAAISEVTMTPERLPEVDFLKPLYSTRYQLFFKSSGMVIQWDLILRPFQMQVWLTLLLWFALLSFLLNVGHRIGLKYGLEDPKYKMEYEKHRCFFFIASAFSQQANSTVPKSGFCRLVLATAYMFSTVVFIIYSCILMSMIAIRKPARPFNSLESFLKDGTYNLHQIPGTDSYSYFSNSTDPILQKIYQTQFSKIGVEDLPTSHASALDRVCGNDKIAHLGEYGVVVLSAEELHQKKGCHLMFLERPLKLLYLTIAVTKDSPYRDAFDFQIGQMAITGVLDRIRYKNFPLWKSKSVATFHPVSIEQTVQMNLLFVAGSATAVFVFLGELLAKRHRCQQ